MLAQNDPNKRRRPRYEKNRLLLTTYNFLNISVLLVSSVYLYLCAYVYVFWKSKTMTCKIRGFHTCGFIFISEHAGKSKESSDIRGQSYIQPLLFPRDGKTYTKVERPWKTMRVKQVLLKRRKICWIFFNTRFSAKNLSSRIFEFEK